MGFETYKVADGALNGTTDPRGPHVVRESGGRLWVAYLDAPGAKVSYSDDEGQTWTYSATVEATVSTNSPLSLVIDSDDNLYLFFEKTGTYEGKQRAKINYCKRTYTTGTWSGATRVTTDETQAPEYTPIASIDGTDRIHLAFEDSFLGPDQQHYTFVVYWLFYAGVWAQWSEVVKDESTPSSYTLEYFLVDPGFKRHVFYSQASTISHKHSDNGVTWGSATEVTTAATNGNCGVYFNGQGKVHVAWVDGVTDRVLYGERSVMGSWGEPEVVSDATGQDPTYIPSYGPSVGCDSQGNVFVVFCSRGYGTYKSQFNLHQRVRDAGGTWGSIATVKESNQNGSHYKPAVMPRKLVAGVYFIWHYSVPAGASEVWFARSDDADFGEFTIPEVETEAADNYDCVLPGLTCDMNGHLIDDGRGGLGCSAYFKYTRGTGSTEYATSTQDKQTGENFEAELSLVAQNQLWWFRAAAMNAMGVAYGEWLKAYCTDLDGTDVPEVETVAATDIGATTATINGTLVDAKGAGSAICYFAWGKTTEYGNYTTSEVVADSEDFHFDLTGLMPNTLYHFQARAINDEGEGYGVDLTFTTKGPQGYEQDNIGVVGTIRRIYDRGVYRMELGLGGFGQGITTIATADPGDAAAVIEPDLIGADEDALPAPTGLTVTWPSQPAAVPWWETLLHELLLVLPHNLLQRFRRDRSPFGMQMSPTIDQIHRSGKPLFSWTTPYSQTRIENTETLAYFHGSRHEDGGADEISIAGLEGTSVALATHEAAEHPHPDASQRLDGGRITDPNNTLIAIDLGGV